MTSTPSCPSSPRSGTRSARPFSSRKQTLLDERQRRIGNVLSAADRILGGVQRRAQTFKTEEELNSWFAADPMVMKLRQLAEQLLGLGDSVKSDELQSRLKSARQDALRGLHETEHQDFLTEVRGSIATALVGLASELNE